MAKTFGFIVVHPGEKAAGINSFDDEIVVIVDSGDPGGDEGEFEAFMQTALAEWYDGAGVMTKEEWKKEIEEENKLWEQSME